MAREAVENLIGSPERTEFGAPEYLSRGIAILYDADGRVSALLAGQSSSPGPLSVAFTGSVAGISMGATQTLVFDKLGEPDAVKKLGSVTWLGYRKPGLTLTLSEGFVHHISVARPCRDTAT
jgi:hypothetical protein